MAGLGPTVKLTFTGDDKNLSRTIKSVEAKTSSLGKTFSKLGKAGGGGLGVLSKGIAGLAAAGGGIQSIAGIGAAAVQLSGGLLLLPAAAMAAGAAMTTFKIATAGVGDAMSAALAGDPAKLAEAMAKLAPAAQGAVREVQALKPAIDALKTSVQQAFFAQFSGEIQKLGNTYLPMLKTQMSGLSAALGDMASQFMVTMQLPNQVGNVEAIFQNTTASVTNMRNALGSAASGLLSIGQVGSTYLPQFGAWLGEISAQFNAWANSMEGQSAIKDWIDQAIQAFGYLFEIIKNVGSIFGSILQGMSVNGGGFLAVLADISGKIAEVFASPAAQAALGMLGQLMMEAGTIISTILVTALNMLMQVFTALGPSLLLIIQAIGTGLTPLLPAISAAVVALAGALVPLAPMIADLAIQIGGALAQAITMVTPLIPVIIDALIQVLAAVMPLIPPILELALAVLPLAIAAFQLAADILTTVVVPVITGLLVPALQLIITVVTAVVQFITAAWEAFKTATVEAFRLIKEAITTALDNVITFVTEFPGKIVDIIMGAIGALKDAGTALINGFLDGIKAAWDGVVDFVNGGLEFLRGLFPFSPAKWGPFSGHGYTSHSGKAMMVDFAKGIAKGGALVTATAKGVMGQAQLSLSRRGNLKLNPLYSAYAGAGAPSASMLGDHSRIQRRNTSRAFDNLGSRGSQLTVSGDTDGALATMLMRLVREGKLQLA